MGTAMTTSRTHAAFGAAHDVARLSSTEFIARGDTVAEPEREEVAALLKTEMQAPLVALRALRSTLDQGGLSPELDTKMRGQTKSLARRLALLLEDLALVYTWGHRRLVVDLQDLDLADQVARAADLFPDLLVYVDAPAGVQVRADSMRLQQLLANLIRSGQRATQSPVCLYVSCLDNLVTLRMIGAPAVDSYELDIVRQLVEVHGGRLRQHPAEGQVTVTLRRVQPALA
jgi:signal transduction histidine kinase